MPSPLFLESLEERALLSGLNAAFGTQLGPEPLMPRFAASGPADSRLLNDGSSLAPGTQAAAYRPSPLESMGDSFLGDPNRQDGSNRGQASAFSTKPDSARDLADGTRMPSPFEEAISAEYDRLRPVDPPDDYRQESVNSVVEALETTDVDKSADEELRADRDSDFHRQDQDATVADHGFGNQGANGGLTSNPTRPLDDLLSSLDLVDASVGIETALLPGPLTDTLILDAWREGVPPPRADLVPAAGDDLTVVATYLVGTAPKSSPASLALGAIDPGPTDFIVGLSAPPSDQIMGPAAAAQGVQGNPEHVAKCKPELVRSTTTQNRDAVPPLGEQPRSILSPTEPQAVPAPSAPAAATVSGNTAGAEGTCPTGDREESDSDEGSDTR
jgi:hypothetical protein